MTLSLRTTLLATATLTFACAPALAQSVDGEAFVARLEAVLNENGASMSHGAVRTEGQSVIVENVSLGTGPQAQTLGEVRFENVAGSNADGWTAESGTVADIEHTEGETVTRAEGIAFADLRIQPEGAAPASGVPGAQAWANDVSLDSLTVTEGDTQTFSLTDLAVSGNFGEGGDANSFEASIADFSVNARPGEDAETQTGLRSLGYEELTGNMSAEGLWNTSTGELTLSPLRIELDDAANMVFAYSISGYTPAFIQQLAALQTQIAANPEAANGANMAMLGLMSQLTLNSAELRLEDQSLTNRILDRSAEQQNISREAMIEQLLAALPTYLGYLNNPQFQSEVTEAVGNFLRDPQSITATIAPAQPIAAMSIATAAMAAPQTLPALLDLSVTSND